MHFKDDAANGKAREFVGSYDIVLSREQNRWKISALRMRSGMRMAISTCPKPVGLVRQRVLRASAVGSVRLMPSLLPFQKLNSFC